MTAYTHRWSRAGLLLLLCGVTVLGVDLAPLATQLSNEFAAIAEKVRPAVVQITAIKERNGGGRGGMRGRPNPFGFPFGPQFPQPDMGPRMGTGSGVIVTDTGYIITNNHVAGNADKVVVKLSDGREFEARIVGTDPDTDIAVLQVEGENLPSAELGDSDALRVGGIVLAIGNPFGLEQTVTSGIISAKGRSNVGISEFEDFLQTDAAINPGNSGGPLVNTAGEVVGINTAIFSRSGSSAGVGFSVPINMARSVMEAIVDDGRVTRGYLGVNIQDMTPDMAEAMGLEKAQGALVAHVFEGTPAEHAGLERGDVVVELNGEPVEAMLDLRNRIAAMRPGTEVKLGILRGDEDEDEDEEIVLEIAERPSQAPVAGRGNIPDVGFEVANLTPEIRERFGIEATQGILVVGVDRGGPAVEAGLAPGMVLLEINRTRVDSVQDFRRVIRGIPDNRNLLLLVDVDGRTRFVLVRRR